MEKFKSFIFTVGVIVVVGLLGFWAVTTLQSGGEHVSFQRIKNLERENDKLKEDVEDLKVEIDALLTSKQAEEEKVEETPKETIVTPPTVYKYQDLINELQKLIDDKVVMKLKSSGTRVGTLQKFLNLYNNTKNTVDNSFGAGTQGALIVFQKAQGLNADGEAGSGTFAKMIEWLKKQG